MVPLHEWTLYTKSLLREQKNMGLYAMDRRDKGRNIPIDIVRTPVAVSETGSPAKAGKKLNISPTAVSSEVKRIELLLGGELFKKTPDGSTVTALGKLVLLEARKILEANDQMSRKRGPAERNPEG